MPHPVELRSLTDPGDATARAFRYQYAYTVMLLAAAKRGEYPCVAVWCEHHEDVLAERVDGKFDAYQIKTSRPELRAWTLADVEFTKSIGRFVDLVDRFKSLIGDVYFVSNKDFDNVTLSNRNERRRGRCPCLFLQHVHNCRSPAEIEAPFDGAFRDLQTSCGCDDADQLLDVLHRMKLIRGPSRDEIDAALSHEHLARLDDCRACNAEQLDAFRDDLIAIVFRASSLQVTDPSRHLRPLIAAGDPDPALAAKRIAVDEVVVYPNATPKRPSFSFPGEPMLELGVGLKIGVIEQKLTAADLEDQIDYMRERARAADYSLLEDVARRPEAFPQLLRQIEQRVHGELSEAHLRARQRPVPYGPAMLIDAQDRLRRLAEERPADVGDHGYECLIGVASLLTNECRVWWGPRFLISVEAP